MVKAVVEAVDSNPTGNYWVYPDSVSHFQKIEAIAKNVYHAGEVTAPTAVKNKLDKWSKEYPNYPVCIAKTQMSFSTDAAKRGAPSGHKIEVREVKIALGAGFIVAICGDMMTMPGLPKNPAAEKIDITDDGRIMGLF